MQMRPCAISFQSFFLSHSRRGFSLIELILVLVLIGVLVGLVVPQVSVLYFDYEFYTFVDRAEKLIAFGQEIAVLEGRRCCLRIDEEERTVRITGQSITDEGTDLVPLPDKRGEITYSDKIRISIPGDSGVYFFPDGTSTHATIQIIFNQVKKAHIDISGDAYGCTVTYE